MLQYLLFGLLTGSAVLLGATGFAMIRRAENFLNIAHGQFLLLGAYLAYYLQAALKWPPWLAAIAAILLTAVTGVVVGKVLFAPVRHHGPVVLLFTSIGLAYVMYGVMRGIAGSKLYAFDLSVGGTVRIGSLTVTRLELLVILIPAVVVTLLHLFLTRTTMGRAIRAVASNHTLSAIRGIHTGRVSSYVWGNATGLAALAGILIGLIGTIHSELGWSQTLIILAAAVLGGLGSLYGVMFGALIMGVVMDMSVMFIPSNYRLAVAFVTLILIMLFRPEGIFKEGA